MKELLPYPQYNNKWNFRYYVSFREEGIRNEKYFGYSGGRLEVYVDEEQYSINEYRFLTNKRSFRYFRNLIGCRHFNIIGLRLIKYILYNFYNDTCKINDDKCT